MLCGETVAVCCEDRTEHTDTVRASQETSCLRDRPNRLMLCGETVAVYCETRTKHTDTACGQNLEICSTRTERHSKETARKKFHL
jgi:hypothetical protein